MRLPWALVAATGCGLDLAPGTSGIPEDQSQSDSAPIALYTFEEEVGPVLDRSAILPALDLEVNGATRVPGGIRFDSETAIVESMGPAEKIIDAVRESQAFSFEVWARSEGLVQGGPARLVSLSVDFSNVNAMLGHGTDRCSGAQADRLHARIRTEDGRADGCPSVEPIDVGPDGTVQHLVLTHDDVGQARLFVNGELVASQALGRIGNSWGPAILHLGREGRSSSGSDLRPWRGILFRVAVFDRPLSASEILQAYQRGVP
ncbi:MAG: LamG domain-containing protein [Myxococcota bacterium]